MYNIFIFLTNLLFIGVEMKNRIHIFTGHFGSGKTEVALNFALQEKKKGEDVVIVDLDIVNPYSEQMMQEMY